MIGPPVHLEELTCPCCIPALGEFSEVPPHEGSSDSLDQTLTSDQSTRQLVENDPPASLSRPQ